MKEYKKGREDAWAREHQVKMFADDFERIGFYMSHKQEILEELAAYNKKQKFKEAKFCSPPKRLTGKSKPRHPAEGSEKLPPAIQGKHFNSFWQICAELGCKRYAEFISKQSRLKKWVRKK